MRNLRTVLLIIAVGLLGAACVKPVRIEGIAMMPALKDGDRTLFWVNAGAVGRGEIVELLYPDDTTKHYVKRVIGLPGETIEIREGKIFVNDKELEEKYLQGPYNIAKPSFPPLVIGADSYYVMGDNRDNSSDSRYWGTVSRELIVGKYFMTYASEK